MVDLNRHNYGVAIQDYDGFVFSGSRRYVAYDGSTRGRKILLGKATMQWGLSVDDAPKHNVPLNSDNTYSKHMPFQKHTGISPRTFLVDCVLVQDIGLEFAPVGFQKLTLPVLLDLLFFNHRYYITDYWGAETSTETPIYQLMNESDSLYYTLYSSQSVGAKGMPVVIKGVNNYRVDPEDPGIATFQMTLIEDTREDA